MNEEKYKYYAFVSYSSKDNKEGKRLVRKLETCRMSSTLCKKHQWKSKKPLNPLFFAPNDIQPGMLTDELENRLRDSRNLIIVCSPHSAKSYWVGYEIAYFHSLGRRDNIYFFIVDGVPNSEDSQTECFHSVVKKLGMSDMLGVNVHEKVYRWPWLNRERAYVQLITKLLGIEFDAQWRRHRRRLIQQVLSWITGLLLVGTLVWSIWNENRTVSVSVELNDTSVQNQLLPPLQNAVVTLSLPNETKKDTIVVSGVSALFSNIPNTYIGQHIRLTVHCPHFMPVDTFVRLSQHVTIDISRDATVFGSGSFLVWDAVRECPLAGCSIIMDGKKMTANDQGIVHFQIPLSEQKTRYKIEVPSFKHTDTLSMPCHDDISAIVVEHTDAI